MNINMILASLNFRVLVSYFVHETSDSASVHVFKQESVFDGFTFSLFSWYSYVSQLTLVKQHFLPCFVLRNATRLYFPWIPSSKHEHWEKTWSRGGDQKSQVDWQPSACSHFTTVVSTEMFCFSLLFFFLKKISTEMLF